MSQFYNNMVKKCNECYREIEDEQMICKTCSLKYGECIICMQPRIIDPELGTVYMCVDHYMSKNKIENIYVHEPSSI